MNSKITECNTYQFQEDFWAMRSSLWHRFVRRIMRITGWSAIMIGIGLLVATAMGLTLLKMADHDKKISSMREAYERLTLITQMACGTAFLLIGSILLFTSTLCRGIVNRNNYIIELERLLRKKTKKENTEYGAH